MALSGAGVSEEDRNSEGVPPQPALPNSFFAWVVRDGLGGSVAVS